MNVVLLDECGYNERGARHKILLSIDSIKVDKVGFQSKSSTSLDPLPESEHSKNPLLPNRIDRIFPK